MRKMKKYLQLAGISATALALIACSNAEGADKEGEKLEKIVIAEPVHSIGYLPLYVADQEGYFAEEGLEVEVLTATGGAHVTSVVSGEAWGNIGGPESNAMANVGSSDPIQSVVNVVNRANVYLMADTKLGYESTNDPEKLKEYLDGTTIAAGRYGGSLNLLTRWLLLELGLEPEEDVKLEEPADQTAVLSLVKSGAAHLANGFEPIIKSGIDQNVWNEPFYKFTDLGDYPFSVLSVKESTIEEEPEKVEGFVNAIVKALKELEQNPDLALEVLKKEFPTTEEGSLKAALDRAYEDDLWSKDGFISEESLVKTMDVVEKTGVFTKGYEYDELIDMQFIEK